MNRLICLVLGVQLALWAADINDELLAAARKGDVAAVKALCDKGATLETKTPYGQTPLYLAAMNGHDDVVRLLLEKGANTEVKDTFYKAPMLSFVLQRKHYGTAKMLIVKGSGSPDVMLADVVSTRNTELVEAVLEKGKLSQSALDTTYETTLDQKLAGIAELLKKAGARDPAPAVEVDPKVLDSYAGTYRSDQIPPEIKVFVKDGKLFVQTGQAEFAPKPTSPTSFQSLRYQMQIDFDSTATFTLRQAGQEFKFKKAASQ